MTNDVLIDTSVWIDYFRDGGGATGDLVDALLDRDRVVLCGVVEMELLHGVLPHEKKTLEEMLSSLPYAEIGRSDFIAAGERLGELRKKGIVIPATDCLIGVLCKRLGLQVLTRDSHFAHLHDVRRLKA